MSENGVRWRPVVGYEGSYEVSTAGDIWSVARVIECSGRVPGDVVLRRIGGHALALSRGANGYLTVGLRSDGRGRTMPVHRAVLEAFVGPPPLGMICRHLDGDYENNRLENLCWGTWEENWADRRRHGLAREGERHYLAKLTNEDVKEMRRLRSEEMVKLSDLSEQFGVSIPQVSLICRRKAWRGV